MHFMLGAYKDDPWLTVLIIALTVAATLLVRRRALRQGTSQWIPVLIVVLIGLTVLALMPLALLLISCAQTGDCV